MSLVNKIRDFSSVYQKEKNYSLYLIKFCDSIIEPFPESCAVCLAEYNKKDSVIKTNCSTMHVFHTECLQEWIKMKANCPLCRENLDSKQHPFVKPYKKESNVKLPKIM